MTQEAFDPYAEDKAAENDYAEDQEQSEGGGCLDPLPPEGRYDDCVVTSAGFRKSQAGNPMWRITVTSTGTPEASSDVYIVITNRAAFSAKPKIEALGLQWPARGEAYHWTKDDFVGKKVAAIGQHEEFRGEQQFKFDELHAPAEGAGARIDLDCDIPF